MHQEILHYFVHGRDKDWFEIRRDETKYLLLTSNESHYGPWRLHYKRKVTKQILENSPKKIIHHHIKMKDDRRNYRGQSELSYIAGV